MKRSKHNLSHYRILSGDFGQLMPISCMEVLPGDTFQHSTAVMLRCNPMLAPVMHQVNVRVHHFFVPNRLSWAFIDPGNVDAWEKFITNSGAPGIADEIPTISYPADGVDDEDYQLMDNFGLPFGNGSYPSYMTVNALPVAAYNLIFNEFYRDQDLVTGRQSYDMTIAKVAWQKDYFTAARPWAQKGGDVMLPLGDSAPVIGTNVNPIPLVPHGLPSLGLTVPYAQTIDGAGPPSFGKIGWNNTDGSDISGYSFGFQEGTDIGAMVDLSDATAADIRDVRLAFALQRFQEARARYGSRYTEYLRYLGVTPADSRLQRPEYLGGGKASISFSEVLQTAEGTDPVATMRGHGIAAVRSNRYRRFFEEHGYVISLLSIVPRNIYSDGTPRHWLKRNYLEMFQRELQDVGQQEVYKGELYPQSSDAANREMWGYSNRYAEYMSHPSQVSGEFRTMLDYWHFARQFNTLPTLNESFVTCNTDKRQFADQVNAPLLIFAHHSIGARRMVRRSSTSRVI